MVTEQPQIFEYNSAYKAEIDTFWALILGKDWNVLARKRWEWLNKRRTHFLLRKDDRILGNATLLRQEFVASQKKSFTMGWITDFYLLPELKGQGMGGRLASHLETATDVVATFGQSEAAIHCFNKLGWTPVHRIPLLGFVLPWFRKFPESPLQMKRAAFQNSALDTIWTCRGHRNYGMGVRNSHSLSERFEGRPDAGYELWVAYRKGEPVGYVILRMIGGRRNRMFGWVPTGLLVDLLAVNDDPAVLCVLSQFGLSRLGRKGAMLVLAVETRGHTGKVLREAGFRQELAIGGISLKALPEKGFMINPKGKELLQKPLHLTFMDCDAELTF